MSVYIEYVIIDNLIINFLLLKMVGFCLKLKNNYLKQIISSVFGTGVAIIMPLLSLGIGYQIIIKCVLGIIMVLLAYKIKSFKTFAISLILFISFTFLMGGACVALILLMGGNIASNSSKMGYDAALPLGLMLAIIASYVWLTKVIVVHFYRRRDCLNFMAKVKVELNGKRAEFYGFIDSGNRVFDNKTGLPVMIVSKMALKNILPQNLLDKIEENKTNPNRVLKNAHFIEYSTLSGNARPMLVFAPTSLEWEYKGKTIKSKVMVGVADYTFCDSVKYDALLHPSMLL